MRQPHGSSFLVSPTPSWIVPAVLSGEIGGLPPLGENMNKYKFIKEPNPDNRYDTSRIEFEVEAETWVELLEEFELFVRGCGFIPKGTFDCVEDE
jgi:hypothetical protein